MTKSAIFFCSTLCILFFNTACKRHLIDYPYAENNTTVNQYFGIDVSDDYEWLKMNPVKNPMVQKWYRGQSEFTDKFFSKRSPSLRNSIRELADFPRFSFIRSSTDTLYYAGLYPYSRKCEIYKFDGSQNHLIKELSLPFQIENRVNALVFNNGKHIALISKEKDKYADLLIYDLRDTLAKPVHTIRQVIDYPLVVKDQQSFFFLRDAFAKQNTVLGVNSVYQCNFTDQATHSRVDVTPVYYNLRSQSGGLFNMAYDESRRDLYIGHYQSGQPDKFLIYQKPEKADTASLFYSINHAQDQQYRLVGADDVNLYIAAIEPSFNGKVCALNIRTQKLDTLTDHSSMTLRGFSLIKNHILVNYKNESTNSIYLINKHSLAKKEIQAPKNNYYIFNHNKKCDHIFYHKESLISPREIYMADTANISQYHKINKVPDLPFNPDDYEIENRSYETSSGKTLNLQLTYKKGMKRDGSNPLMILTYLNAENSLLDKYLMVRTLYMDRGFIFVQRALSDSRMKIDVPDRAEGIYESYSFLVNEKYTSPGKVAFVGREFGASALMSLMNKHKIGAPMVLINGVYDFVHYNDRGLLRYHNEKLLHANDSTEFRNLYAASPYHQVVEGKDYPPVLLMSTNNKDLVPESQTYRMTAKLQMRTKGHNPIAMLDAGRIDRLEDYEEYTYKMFIEHGFLFIARELGIQLD